MNRWAQWLLVGALLLAASCSATAADERLDAAHKAYAEGNYQVAAQLLQQAIDTGGADSASLHHALGLCRARLQEWGPAMLELRRAARLAPGDRDLQQALAWVRGRLPDAQSGGSSPRVTLLRLLGFLPLGFLVVASSCAALAALWLAVRAASRERSLGSALGVALIALLLAAPALTRAALLRGDQSAVLLAPRVDARSGPEPSAPILFTAHAGFELEWIERRRDQYRVALPSGISAWIDCKEGAAIDRGSTLCDR